MEQSVGLLRQRYIYKELGISPEKSSTTKKETIDDRIHQLEREINEIDGKVFQTSSSAYGNGHNVELYKDSKYNIHENKDLRALERRLPKGWKKAKWTPRTFSFTKPWTPSTLCPSWARRSERDSPSYLS
jgi:hypothetical protein